MTDNGSKNATDGYIDGYGLLNPKMPDDHFYMIGYNNGRDLRKESDNLKERSKGER